MRVVLAGGTGLIGRDLSAHLQAAGYETVVLTRQPNSPNELDWDAKSVGPWASALEGAAAVVNLTGKPISHRMTAANKQEMLDSRVRSSYAIKQAIEDSANRPNVWINAGAVGFYGDRGDEVLTEKSKPGTGFLPEVCKAWEAPLHPFNSGRTRNICLRIGFVLAADGGGLPLLAKLARLYLGGPLGSGRQWMSWIHIDDLSAIFRWCIETDASGIYNAVSPNPVTNAEFMRTLRKLLHRWALPNPPEPVLKLFGKLMAPDPSLGLISCRALPERLQDQDFHFQYPNLAGALDSLAR